LVPWRRIQGPGFNDRYFPDLRDFFNTLSVIWCGCFQGPDDNGTSPYAYECETLIKADDQFKNAIFYNFIRDSIEHPYNVHAVARMVCHACFNDVNMTTRILTYSFNFLANNASSQISCSRVACALLDIADDYQDARMYAFLSPSISDGKTGVIGVLQLAQQPSRTDSDLLRHL